MQRYLPSLILSLLICLLSPTLGHASQQAQPSDSTYALAITHLQLAYGRVSYFSSGAKVNIRLKNGQKLQQVVIGKVRASELEIDGKIVAFSDIARISQPRPGATFLGVLMMLVGLPWALWITALTITEWAGREDRWHFLPSLGLLAGGLFLLPWGRTFNLLKRKFSLGTAPMSSLSANIRQKLSQKAFVK